jgi:hypothetical protein
LLTSVPPAACEGYLLPVGASVAMVFTTIRAIRHGPTPTRAQRLRSRFAFCGSGGGRRGASLMALPEASWLRWSNLKCRNEVLGGGSVPATSRRVSAPTRWIRKHGPGLATSTGAIKVPMTALAIARMHCLPRLSYSDRLSMLGFYLRAGVMSVSPFFFSATRWTRQFVGRLSFAASVDKKKPRTNGAL